MLSVSQEPEAVLDFGSRRVRLFPDYPQDTEKWLAESHFTDIHSFQTDFAVIFKAVK